MEDINGKIGQIAKEMQIFAKKNEVKTLQKYVTMWEPIKFVTENQVEEIVKDIISKTPVKFSSWIGTGSDLFYGMLYLLKKHKNDFRDFYVF